jgi:hypothetical protein
MYIKGNEITISCAHVKVPRSKSIESSKIVKKHEGDDEVEGKNLLFKFIFTSRREKKRNGTAVSFSSLLYPTY